MWRRVGWLSTLALAGASLLLGVVLQDWFAALDPGRKWLLLAASLTLAGVGGFLQLRLPSTIRVRRDTRALYTPEMGDESARRAFIGFVPLYTPQGKDHPAAGQPPEVWDAAARRGDYAALDLEHSNFAPTIQAILSHRSRLQHCQLLVLQRHGDPRELRPYADLLAKYLTEQHQLTCQFPVEVISYVTDSDIFEETHKRVDRLIRDGENRLATTPAPLINPQHRTPTNDLVVDFTTEVRTATIGLILACLNEERDLEFMGTAYDETGRPTGSIVPILFHFKPELRHKE